MRLFYKRKVTYNLTFEDGDLLVTWHEMQQHISYSINGSSPGYFHDLPYFKNRNPKIDEYLIKEGIAKEDSYGALEVTEKTKEFVDNFNALINTAKAEE